MTAPSDLGPNDLQPCGTVACHRWHLAHGYNHRCGVDVPNYRRTQGQPLRAGEPVVVCAPWCPPGDAA